MKKFLRSKALAAAVLLLVILLFLGGVFAGGFFSRPYDTTEYIALNMFLDGEYAIDDGEWKPLDPEQPVRENFQTIVFRGKLNKAAACHDGLQIFSRNVWYTLAAEDGTIVSSFQPKTLEEAYDVYAGKVSEEYQMPELWFSVMQRFKPLQYRLLQSPGYRYAWLRTDTMQADALYTLEVINPYPVFNNSFSDCFSVNAGNVNSEIWMLADTGREMSGICPGGEKQADVAMNALRMFAMLSLRRSDDVSLVLSGENSIIRHRISGGYAAFDRIAKKIAEKNFTHERDLNSLIEYAKKIRAKNCLIVIATDDSSWSKESLKGLEILAQTHPLVIICTETFNPFKPDSKFKNTVDGKTGKKLPAFMKTAALAKEVDRHRKFISAALERKMAQIGAFMLYADSSETMSKQFIRLVCASQNSSKHFGGANISRKDNAA